MNHKCRSHLCALRHGVPAACSRSTWGPPLPAQEVHGVPCHLTKEHVGSRGPSSAPRGEKWCMSERSTADSSPRCAVPFPWHPWPSPLARLQVSVAPECSSILALTHSQAESRSYMASCGSLSSFWVWPFLACLCHFFRINFGLKKAQRRLCSFDTYSGRKKKNPWKI